MTKKEVSGVEPQAKYVNRDLSWIEFNRRVLEEAQDPNTPLFERLKFLSIVSTNLDEFMSVRVAGIKEQVKIGIYEKDFTGYTPATLLRKVLRRSMRLTADQYRTHRELLRHLAKEGIRFHDYDSLNETQREWVDHYFHDIVFPVLTPMAVDQSRPFPLVHSLELYLAVTLCRDGEEADDGPYFAIVQVPSILRRAIQLPGRAQSKKRDFLMLEQLIKRHIHTMFSGYTVAGAFCFRITRDADLSLNEEDAEDLLEEIEKEVRKRRWGSPVRLEVEKGMNEFALEMLQEEFEIGENVFDIEGPLDLGFYMKMMSLLPEARQHRFAALPGRYPKELVEEEEMFAVLRRRDVLVYHPYESFDAIDDFLTQSAVDPQVLAIKMTLYRVSGNSVIVQALARAAEAGKQVTVVVELKARFDEERNIAWARKLEQAGCHVVYGLIGLKTHAKMTLVVRREQDGLRRYVHIGTGNYNDSTARLYTDVGILTTNPDIGEDASALFNEITGYSSPHRWKALSVAPADLKGKLLALIKRETENARAGKPARIIAKMNSLSNQEMVDACYEASQAGVNIDLIVRGVCCLCPGVPEMSERIRVISVVDRYLEHSRIFYFENGGQPEVYISSSDWMTRNLERRIELMLPIFDQDTRKNLINILQMTLNDNVKARLLLPTGLYETPEEATEPYQSQFEASRIDTWKTGRIEPLKPSAKSKN